MNTLTPEGEKALTQIAQKYNISLDSALSMSYSVNNGGGTMAQFSIPELGSGQWMQGGMTMCGDMFNHGLKATVNNLCGELSNLMATTQVLQPAPQGSGSNGMGGGSWWPSELGSPSSSGGQNGMQYAYFPSACRLAISVNGEVSIYNTLNHQIGGVQQQQGGGSSLSFTSQYGTFSSLDLPLISGPGSLPSNQNDQNDQNTQNDQTIQNQPVPNRDPDPEPLPVADDASPNSQDTFKSIQQLGDLHQAGILTDQEFADKKAELLSRL